MAQTYYQLLGVAENATNAEIEAAFKSKAREVHPDKVPPGNPYLRKVASEAFKDLSEAKSVLLDSAERRKYDAKLAYMRGSGPSYAAPTTPPPPPSSPPAPASTSQQAQRYSFWKPSKTRFGAGVLAALSLGCILLLVGITAGDKTALLGLTLLCLALALLCWRHGGRPGTDAAFLGGSVFLFIFAAISFAGWLQSAPSDPRVPIATAARLTQAQATPVVPNKIPCRSPDGQPCVSTAALPQKLKIRTVSVEGVGDFEVPADWDQSKIRSYLKAYKRKYPKSFERQTPNPTDKSAPSSATASHGLSSVSMGGQSHR